MMTIGQISLGKRHSDEGSDELRAIDTKKKMFYLQY